MAEQMEQINVEEIMQDIRTQIAERGYTKNELKFADVAAKTGEMSDEIDDYFELDRFEAHQLGDFCNGISLAKILV